MRERSEKEHAEMDNDFGKLKYSEGICLNIIDGIDLYAIVFLNEAGLVQFWNKGAESMFCFKKEEISGKHFNILFSQPDRDAGLPEFLLQGAREMGKSVHGCLLLRKDTTQFWASISLSLMHEEIDAIKGYSVIARKYNEEKSIEDQLKIRTIDLEAQIDVLRFSEERYHRMVEEVQDYAIILLDNNGIIQNWNKGAQKIKQYKESEAVGRHFRMFYLPEDRLGKLPEILLEQARIYGRATHEGWRMRKDKTKFWGSIALTALHNKSNELIGYSKVTRDLTEKKLADDQMKNFTIELQRSNEELRKSEERYHKMIAEVSDYAIILLDINGNILNWNLGAQKIKGYTEEEIIGKNFSIFYTEEDRLKKLPQHLLSTAAEKGKAVHEGWRVTKLGKKFWGSVVITALHDELGSIIGYSKVTRDLTINKQANEKLKEYLHELQIQNEELDQFAYTASHDLQEPLRKIRMFANLIVENLEDRSAVQKYLNDIDRASQRMQSMIAAVLKYSRLSKNTDEKIFIDLNQVVTEAIDDLELTIKEKQADILVDKLPVVKMNPLQANQLFVNLIGNSLKYSKEKPDIKISASVVSEIDPKFGPVNFGMMEYHQIIVSDNGIGFEPEYANLIFSIFQRLHGKQEYSGTGIGLALCRKIMDNHNGYIFAQGNPGNGSMFFVYLPIDRKD